MYEDEKEKRNAAQSKFKSVFQYTQHRTIL